MASTAAEQLATARRSKRWTLAELAGRAGISTSAAQAAEAGQPMSLDTYARLAAALGLRPSLSFESGRAGSTRVMTRDVVHSAMGECEAAHLARLGLTVAMDEPYQHYQFARRADVLAWDLANSRLLHNREQVTNRGRPGARRRLQRETCLTLPPAIGERLGVGPRGWQTVSHVLVALWSSEVLHALRMRTATFRALARTRLTRSRRGGREPCRLWAARARW
jgi:transcriptional regulator with XRE-family HTH domain